MEVQVYLAKFLADPRRNEPRNVGLLVRTAKDELLVKFLLEDEQTHAIPKQLDLREFGTTVGKWREAIDKYGVKALNWIGKRKAGDQKLYIEFAHGEMAYDFDFDRLFEELVL